MPSPTQHPAKVFARPPSSPVERIYRRSPWALLPLVLFLAGAALFLIWVEFQSRRWIAGGLAFINGLLAILAGWRIVALMRPENWVLRLTRDSLIVNAAAPGTVSGGVMRIPFKSIAHVRRITGTVERIDSEGDRVQGNTLYLEVGLDRLDTDPLKGAGAPVRVDDAHRFSIVWRDRHTRLTPSIDSLVDALNAGIGYTHRLRDERLLRDSSGMPRAES